MNQSFYLCKHLFRFQRLRDDEQVHPTVSVKVSRRGRDDVEAVERAREAVLTRAGRGGEVARARVDAERHGLGQQNRQLGSEREIGKYYGNSDIISSSVLAFPDA